MTCDSQMISIVFTCTGGIDKYQLVLFMVIIFGRRHLNEDRRLRGVVKKSHREKQSSNLP